MHGSVCSCMTCTRVDSDCGKNRYRFRLYTEQVTFDGNENCTSTFRCLTKNKKVTSGDGKSRVMYKRGVLTERSRKWTEIQAALSHPWNMSEKINKKQILLAKIWVIVNTIKGVHLS